VSAPVVRVTRTYRFAAAHRLHAAALSADENREIFGKCNNPFGHGHNYLVEVAFRGAVDASTGRAADPPALDRLIAEQVLAPFHHANLNEDVPEFRGTVPTTENLALVIERRLRAHWKPVFGEHGPALDYVRVQETKNNKFQTTGR
jgi:6-pyruvoyltetrahydropterin/6-carboxytetrahydropterin synthase